MKDPSDSRFHIGLQDPKDKTRYVDVEYSEKEKEAIAIADEYAAKHPGRQCIVWDKKSQVGIIYKTPLEEEKKRPEPFNSKRRKR